MRNFRRDQSGQAMTEGVIGLALLCMVLMMAAVISHMYINRISCLSAARHAAWISGNGQELALLWHQPEFKDKFFYESESLLRKIVGLKPKHTRNGKVKIDAGSPPAGLLEDLKLPKSWTKDKLGGKIVTYGVPAGEATHGPNALLPFPMMFLKSDMPIIDEGRRKEEKEDKKLAKTISRVDGDAAWPDVKDQRLEAASITMNAFKQNKPLIEGITQYAKSHPPK
jgi:hypothetical protein